MKNTLLIVIAIVVIILLAGGYVLYMHGTSSKSSTNSTTSTYGTSNMPMPSPTPTPNPSTSAQATDAVTIQNFAFSPAAITVKAGTKVTWTNKDSVAHTVTESDGKTGPDSGDVNPGSSYSFTFATAGTYTYHCTIHPSMVATVTVTP